MVEPLGKARVRCASLIEDTPCAQGTLDETFGSDAQSHDHQKSKADQENHVNGAPFS